MNHSSTEVSSSRFTSILTFHPLHTSQGGAYTCEARFNISEADAISTTAVVTVQSKSILFQCYGLVLVKMHRQ